MHFLYFGSINIHLQEDILHGYKRKNVRQVHQVTTHRVCFAMFPAIARNKFTWPKFQSVSRTVVLGVIPGYWTPLRDKIVIIKYAVRKVTFVA